MSHCVKREEEGSDRPESPTSICVSMKSDWSKGKPPDCIYIIHPGTLCVWIKRPAKQTTDDDDWECRRCSSRNTVEDLRCRRCNVIKLISTSWSSITALPLSAAHMRKSWHKDITQRGRNLYVRYLVRYRSTVDPAEDIKDLVTDAQNTERNIYESANSGEEYDRLMDEKWSELWEKRLEDGEMEQMEMSMDQTSTPPLPLGDKKEKISGDGCKDEAVDTSSSSSSSSPFLSFSEDDEEEEEGSTPVSVGVYHQDPASLPFHQTVDLQGTVTSQGSLTPPSSTADMPQDKSESFQRSPEEIMSCNTACDLSTTDRPVTESLSSVHHSVELQDETDLNSCFSSLRMEESISLPRSHSLPSLSQIPCLENKTSFRAKCSHSLNDVTLLDKTQKITPDIIVVESKESYRFHCAQAGLFQCSVTDLVFKMETEGDVTYRTVPWHRRLLSQLSKRPAGPMFDIKGSQGSVCQLHFPHCEILSMGGGKSLSVVHVMDDDGFELIKPHKITETHVIIDVTGLSFFGVIIEMLYGPSPVQALVSVFYTPPIDDDDPSSILKVLLLPENVVLSEVMDKRRSIREEIYIEMPQCELIPKQEYTLSTSTQDDSIIILPNKVKFKVDESSYHNYNASFVINLEERFKNVRLLLSNSKTSIRAWEGYVKLSAAALRKQQVQRTVTLPAEERLFSVRSSFIDRVSLPNLNGLLDKLLEGSVITDAEREMVDGMQVRKEKARCAIDTVRRKGPDASSKIILILCDLDTCLSEHLGLMSNWTDT